MRSAGTASLPMDKGKLYQICLTAPRLAARIFWISNLSNLCNLWCIEGGPDVRFASTGRAHDPHRACNGRERIDRVGPDGACTDRRATADDLPRYAADATGRLPDPEP